MINLYHGSNVIINEIDLKRGRRGKDFGQGFYLNADLQQATAMAERVVDREGYGEPHVSAFLFDENVLRTPPPHLYVKTFISYSVDWAEFILLNRRNNTDKQVHEFDIVYGPIADDKVGLQLSRYQLNYISIEELVKQLSSIRPTFQYFFGTERALAYLQKQKDNDQNR